jgi:flagellar biosynthesis protein FlhB
MASDEQGERTEQATDAKREEFRRRGQVASSREFATAAIFLFAALFLYMFGRHYYVNIVDIFEHFYGGGLVAHIRSADTAGAMAFVGLKIFYLLGPLFGLSLLIGVASQVLQTGFLNIEDALSPDLNKINPLNALKRIFSMRGVVDLMKSLLKMGVIFVVIYFLLRAELKQIPHLSSFSIQQLMAYIGGILFKLLVGAGFFMLAIALADYMYQRWQIEQDMMMTKQEIKEEMKSREGDPMIKARVRKIQREMAMRKMMTEVPKGDVVITNPTHIAVVLKYTAGLPAPQLIAKGADFVAEKIKEIAREKNIPIIENKPLARTIFKTLKIGQIIPKDLFVAVAEVLSYVYRLKKKKMKRTSTRAPEQGV